MTSNSQQSLFCSFGVHTYPASIRSALEDAHSRATSFVARWIEPHCGRSCRRGCLGNHNRILPLHGSIKSNFVPIFRRRIPVDALDEEWKNMLDTGPSTTVSARLASLPLLLGAPLLPLNGYISIPCPEIISAFAPIEIDAEGRTNVRGRGTK
ncbi:hypothetical protein BDW22DRAFT_1363048 [Trametopsis cervina]|nr:hypothetical protein BDW22DRAFT_1363048 [Trametopsis cervina]